MKEDKVREKEIVEELKKEMPDIILKKSIFNMFDAAYQQLLTIEHDLDSLIKLYKSSKKTSCLPSTIEKLKVFKTIGKESIDEAFHTIFYRKIANNLLEHHKNDVITHKFKIFFDHYDKIIILLDEVQKLDV